MTDHFTCILCGWFGAERQLLSAALHPLEPMSERIHGCPCCHQTAGIRRGCDTEGCRKQATIGRPSRSAHTWHCPEHA